MIIDNRTQYVEIHIHAKEHHFCSCCDSCLLSDYHDGEETKGKMANAKISDVAMSVQNVSQESSP